MLLSSFLHLLFFCFCFAKSGGGKILYQSWLLAGEKENPDILTSSTILPPLPLHHATSRIILDYRKCSPREDIYNKSLAHLACCCLEYPAAHFVLVSNKLFPDNLVDKRDSSPSDLHTSFKKMIRLTVLNSLFVLHLSSRERRFKIFNRSVNHTHRQNCVYITFRVKVSFYELL